MENINKKSWNKYRFFIASNPRNNRATKGINGCVRVNERKINIVKNFHSIVKGFESKYIDIKAKRKK